MTRCSSPSTSRTTVPTVTEACKVLNSTRKEEQELGMRTPFDGLIANQVNLKRQFRGLALGLKIVKGNSESLPTVQKPNSQDSGIDSSTGFLYFDILILQLMRPCPNKEAGRYKIRVKKWGEKVNHANHSCLFEMRKVRQQIFHMDNRPIKGNSSGKYDMSFVDPTNDICAYYGGMTELQQLVENYLETVTFHKISKAQLGKSQLYGAKSKEQHYLDHCSVCLGEFQEGQKVKILPCRHCFHRDCVVPWFQSNSHCPNCRFQLPTKPE